MESFKEEFRWHHSRVLEHRRHFPLLLLLLLLLLHRWFRISQQSFQEESADNRPRNNICVSRSITSNNFCFLISRFSFLFKACDGIQRAGNEFFLSFLQFSTEKMEGVEGMERPTSAETFAETSASTTGSSQSSSFFSSSSSFRPPTHPINIQSWEK